MGKPVDFDTSVFINCPSDEQYKALLYSIVFTTIASGFKPRAALQEYDGGTVRLEKICRLIRHSRLGIHDISRTELDTGSGLPRFNMPFELGLDLGARAFGNGQLAPKQMLILDKEQYRFQQFISDIAGQDIAAHRGSAVLAMTRVRMWLNSLRCTEMLLPGSAHLKLSYESFKSALPEICLASSLEPATLDFNDFSTLANQWLSGDI